MNDVLDHYREIWLADFEFRSADGERPEPLCMVAREWRTGRMVRLWSDDLARLPGPPFPIDSSSLFVAYLASAELGCFLSLKWPMPKRVLDLFCEFRCHTNGLPIPCGNGLLGALTHFGLDSVAAAEKQAMRELALRPGEHTAGERKALIDYCQTDVDALARLLPGMMPRLDLPRALLRGRFMAAVAAMEWNGIPIDQEMLSRFREGWDKIKASLIRDIDKGYGIFVPTCLDPKSRMGSEILAFAEDWGIDANLLFDASGEIWRTSFEGNAEFRKSIAAARKETGLTFKQIQQWEDSGYDYSTWPGLDVKARELAGQHPLLGLGRGYIDNVLDDKDYAGLLWDLLRKEPKPVMRRSDPAILRQAAELVKQAGDDYLPTGLSFSAKRFADWLSRSRIPWPRLPSGVLALDDDSFRQMAKVYPQVAPLREIKHSLSTMRLFENLAVGRDGRNRCLLSVFRATSGRNAPSNAKFIFGPSRWLRSLIMPEFGNAVAYVDWSQQEFGIAAALSGDTAMAEAYLSGDPYLTFAKQAGAVPHDATKHSHRRERDLFKTCALGVQYGMEAESLASRIEQPPIVASELLRLHRRTYPKFWKWSDAAVNHAMLFGWLQTVFGWRVHVGQKVNPRSLGNFPMQANGAEMLRLACCLATERGIRVCCPVHDALLVEGPSDEIEDVVTATQAAMAEASRVVLSGFELRSDAKIFRYPNRYVDDGGEAMWNKVIKHLERLYPAATYAEEPL